MATSSGSVQAVVRGDGWPADVREAVVASLNGQVARVVTAEECLVRTAGSLLVVTIPVVFARGALGRLRRLAAHPGRVVTRVLVPGEEPSGLALWSAEWLARSGFDAGTVVGGGLEFDRTHLAHDDPYVRAWVSAHDIGVVKHSVTTDPERWARVEGVRLGLARTQASARSLLGRIRRSRSLARQRREQRA